MLFFKRFTFWFALDDLLIQAYVITRNYETMFLELRSTPLDIHTIIAGGRSS